MILMPPVTSVNYCCSMTTNTSQLSRFSDWLRTAMKMERWNRAETAAQLGIDPSTVSRWLKGERIPSPEMCDRVADIFGVDLDFVLNLAGHRPPIFEHDPASPEGRLLPLIRQVDWESRPTRLAEIENDLRFMIQIDREQRERESKASVKGS